MGRECAMRTGQSVRANGESRHAGERGEDYGYARYSTGAFDYGAPLQVYKQAHAILMSLS